jgi:hypothetical protein
MGGFLSRLFGKKPRDDDEPADLEDMLKVGPRVDTVDGATGRFGYDRTNPIPCNAPAGEIDYLARLRCACGQPFLFHRVGNFGPGPDGHIIDGFELLCTSRVCHVELFMDMYHEGPSALVPEGLTRGTRRGAGVTARVDDFPDGLLRLLVERGQQAPD